MQTDQAEADKRIAQAKAEERRAMAVAKEQEMKASVQEMRAKVVEAEAEVPLAMAEAFRRKPWGYGLLQYEKHPCRYQHRDPIAAWVPPASSRMPQISRVKSRSPSEG